MKNAIKASSPGGVVQLGKSGQKMLLGARLWAGHEPERWKIWASPFTARDKARSRRAAAARGWGGAVLEIARQHGAQLQYFSRPGEVTLSWWNLKRPDAAGAHNLQLGDKGKTI